MGIQAQFNNEVFIYFSEIANRIKNAPLFEANQMKCKTLHICNNLRTPLSLQTKEQLATTENYILGLFKYNEWL